MENFKTIRENTKQELIEKKSKFIADVFYLENKEEAQKYIQEIKKKYYDARHHCYAYRFLEDGNILEKSSDDGEPSGTAGAPILSLLKGEDLINVLVVVTRYFGGILLGTGGLVRAYSEATSNAIKEANVVYLLEGWEEEITLDYKDLDSFEYYCKKHDISILNTEYLQTIKLRIEVSESEKNELENNLSNVNFKIIEMEKIRKKYIRKNAEI